MDELGRYLPDLVERTHTVLGDDLVGVYLHGSAALGAFVSSRSDVDVLVVTRSPMAARAKAGLAESLAPAVLPCPGVGLELSVVRLASARTGGDAPSFELHVGTEEGRVVDGARAEGDPDLVAHFATARARGIALAGPPPQEVFGAVPRRALVRSFANDLAWAVEHGRAGYAVLNACRALRSALDGGVYSKIEGGEWALEHGVGNAGLIEAALRRQRGADEAVDPAAAEAFAVDIRERLLAAAAGSPSTPRAG